MARPSLRVTDSKNLRLSKRAAGGDDYVALVAAARDGDRLALEQLLLKAQEVAYRFSLTICGRADDAEDVMQEALLKTYRYVSRIEHPEAFKSWLYKTVKNVCLMRHRKRVHEPRQVLSLDEFILESGESRGLDVPDRGRNPEELAANAGLRRRLKKALGALPAHFRMIVFLRDMEGLSTRDVAHVTGLSEANVKARLHRARLFLQQRLGRES